MIHADIIEVLWKLHLSQICIIFTIAFLNGYFIILYVNPLLF